MICGLITPRYMLEAFGSEANGAVSSISTFLGYITLLEGGIGGVARAALYRPLAEKDDIKISTVVAEIKRFFRKIGIVFCIYVLFIAFFFKSISHTEALDWATSFFLVIVISISTFAQYFIGISNSILIIASQRQYVSTLINVFGTVTNAALIVLLTSLGYNLITVKLVSSFVFSLKPVALWIYVNKNYNIIPTQKSENALKDKWTGLGQHIAYFLHSHTDIVVLTIFGNLKAVSVYSVYYMVTSAIQSLTASFSSGMEAVFGDMYARREMNSLNNAFNVYETLVSIIALILFGTTIVLIIPFVSIYTRNINDTNYIEPTFGLLLSIAGLLFCLRSPYHNMIIAAGHFRQTNVASYGEAGINLFLSILLVVKYGLVGVAIGTIVATFFRFVFYVVHLSKNIMLRSINLWIRRMIVNMFIIAIIYLGGKYFLKIYIVNSYFTWFISGIFMMFFSCSITMVIHMLFYRYECTELFRRFVNKRNR